MTNDKGIFIKNIYYMLTYAFKVLRQANYDDVASEEFKEIYDLFAAILAKGISQQLKQGLYREYVTKNEKLSVMRGKLEIQGTVQNKLQRKKILSCEFDELTEDNIFNQILKTTANILIHKSAVKPERKKALKKVLLFFNNVEWIEPSRIRWNLLHFQKTHTNYQRSNKNYEMLINICYFVLDDLLQTTEKGNKKMVSFLDENMANLFEKFVLEYYKHHRKDLTAYAAQVKWNLGTDVDKNMIKFLPVMQTDITLEHGDKVLIIDTKYYTHTMQQRYDKYTVHSKDMYQIFTYVKNRDKNNSGNVSGMLLYALTREETTPNSEYLIGGNKISIRTLNLNTDFENIKKQLDEIGETYL